MILKPTIIAKTIKEYPMEKKEIGRKEAEKDRKKKT